MNRLLGFRAMNRNEPKTKDQRPQTKDQRPKPKDQGPKTKDQGPKTKAHGEVRLCKSYTKGIADGTMHNAPIHLSALSHAHALVFESRLSHGIRDSAGALLC